MVYSGVKANKCCCYILQQLKQLDQDKMVNLGETEQQCIIEHTSIAIEHAD